MTLLAFPHRSPEPARTVAALATMKRTPDPSCEIVVTKDTRVRRYAIWQDAPGHWAGEVWCDRAQHRRSGVFGVHDARMLAFQFARELRDLLADGWSEA